mgnify:CR=1 FL=1
MSEVDAMAKKLKINQVNVLATNSSRAEAVDEIQNVLLKGRDLDAFAGRDVNKIIKEQLKDLQDSSKRLTFQSWKATNENLNAELNKQLSYGNGQQIRDLEAFINIWDKIQFRGKGGEAIENLQKFKDFYRETIVDPFRNAAVSKVLRKASGSTDNTIKYDTSGELVAREFLNNVKNAEIYMNIHRGSAENVKAIQDAFKDRLIDRSLNKGIIDVQKLSNALNKEKDLIKALNLDEQLTNVDNTIQSLMTRQSELLTRKKVIDANNVVKTIAKLDKEGRPTELIDEAIKSKDTTLMSNLKNEIDQLAKQEKDPGIVDAFNAIIMNRIMSKAPTISNEVMGNPVLFRQFLDGAETKLRAALGDEHFDNVRLVSDGMVKILATDINPGTTGTGNTVVDAFEKATGSSLRQVSTRAMDMRAGRIGRNTFAMYFMSRAVRAQSGLRADKLIEESLYDPNLAKFLSQEVDPVNGPSQKQLKEINMRLLKLGFYGGLSGATEERPKEADDIMFEFSPGASVAPTEEPPIQVAEITRPTNIPTPGMPQNNRITTSVADLFPNDATSASIGRRRQGGITSLVWCMVEPVTAVLTGIALVKKSVDFIKTNISTAQDIGDIVGHVDKALNGQQDVIRARDKANVDHFATENIAKEVIDAKLAQEQLDEMRQLIDYRFGHGTWAYILEERKRRIDAKKQAIKEEKARRLKKRQEIEEYVKYGFITLAVILFVVVAIGITIKFVLAHPPIEGDEESCKLYEPKYFMICMNEGRGYADTELYLDYKFEKDNWIIEED